MKDFLKLFKTIMDLKGLTFVVLKQSMIKTLRLIFCFFFWPWLKTRLSVKMFWNPGITTHRAIFDAISRDRRSCL